MPATSPRHPDWDRLYEIAGSQEGLFTTRQAAEAGYSPQLLVHHLSSGRALLFAALAREKHLEGLAPSAFSARAAHYLGEMNALHPFREGNGRAQRDS